MMESHSMPLNQLLADYVKPKISVQIEISGLAIDHRKVRPGYLFLACCGISTHGKFFIEKAIDAGAVAIVVETETPEEMGSISSQHCCIPMFAIEKLSMKLSAIAARFYFEPSKYFSLVGITGTNGKTSCAHLLAQCLNEPKHPCGVLGTLGAGIWGRTRPIERTTPDAIELQSWLYEMQQEHASYVAMEVSSHGLTQGRVTACLFDIAVFTNLTRDHLDYHGDMASYGKAKLQLFTRPELAKAVLNLDDPYTNTIIANLRPSVEVVGITLNSSIEMEKMNIISASNIRLEQQGLSFDVNSPWGCGRLQSRLLGDFNVSNLLAVVAVALFQGLPFKKILERLTSVQAPAGRLETFDRHAMPLIVVDYAHTPDAMKKVLETLQTYISGKLYLLFGCGGDRDRGKRAKMGALAEQLADVVWLTDDNPRTEKSIDIIDDILAGVQEPQSIFVEFDRAIAIKNIISVATADDVVLIAGKGHESYQIVGDEQLEFSDRDWVTKILEEAA